MRTFAIVSVFIALVAACSSAPITPEDGGCTTCDGGGGVDASIDAPKTCAPLADVGDAGAGPQAPLYPDPKYASVGANASAATHACVDTSALATHDKLDALVPELLAEVGLSAGSASDCTCDWTLRFGAAPSLSGTAQSTLDAGKSAPEINVEVTTEDGGHRATTSLFATTERGALYALRAALATATKSQNGVLVPTSTIVDYPDIIARGFLDGIYRTIGGGYTTFNGWPSAYTPAMRSEILRLMQRLRGNTFIYGPKCDQFGRGATCSGQGSLPNWTTPYPTHEGEQSAIVTLAADADKYMIDLYWALNPVTGVDWSQPTGQPLTDAKKKIDELRAMGVHHFAMFVDDANPTTPQNASLLMNATNAYLKSLDPTDHLLVVTWAYNAGWGAGTQQAFGTALDKDVEVMWTGNDVEPCTLAAGDMTGPNANYKRTLSIWDNWPSETTGCAGAYRKMIGRAADLPKAIHGYYHNPVINEDGAPLSEELKQLGPIFDFAWGAAHYDAAIDASYARWASIMPGWQAIDHPCSNTNCIDSTNSVFNGFACDGTDKNTILFCDTYEGKCVTKLTCPKGCTIQSNAMDTCN
jgi:hyaluronoglucosaminidase